MADLRNFATGGNGRGSELMAIAEVTNVTSFTLGTVFAAPWIMDSNLNVATTEEVTQGEGTFSLTQDGTRTDQFTVTFGQKDAATKNFLMYGMKGKTWCFVKKETSAAIVNEHQWRVYPMVQQNGSYTINAIGNEVEMVFNVLENSTLLTVDLTTFNSAGGWSETLSCTTFVIPALQRHALYAQAVS